LSYADFYRARADEAKEAASVASLERVRAKYLQAEAAWTKMAERIEAHEKMRSTSS
jgi:hypothetical protein